MCKTNYTLEKTIEKENEFSLGFSSFGNTMFKATLPQYPPPKKK